MLFVGFVVPVLRRRRVLHLSTVSPTHSRILLHVMVCPISGTPTSFHKFIEIFFHVVELVL